MNIGELWDPKNWDDAPLEPEELEKTLAIHRRHRDAEEIRVRFGSKWLSGRSNKGVVRRISEH